MSDELQGLQNKIKLLQNATKIERLLKGYSPDEKYVVHVDEKKLLLRVGSMKEYERKKVEFQIINKMQQYNVLCPRSIEIGLLDDLDSCYTIYSYIDGIDGTEALPTLTEQEQMKIGIEAGRQLSRMHLYKAPLTIKPWYDRAMEKHYKYLEAYKSCGIKINNDDKIIEFIERNKHFIKNRPNNFQHDDFHLGNIIMKGNKYAGVIDFNNFDWGDPFHDFVKVALFQRKLSIPFSIGQIEGYFNNNIRENFWRIYAIYAGMVIFSSVVWSINYMPQQLDEMIERLYNILEDHKNFEILKPSWYKTNLILS
ncbi:aminoglycoside phosphotransferase family protein [Cytobacillus sp. Hm23]